MSAVGEMKLAVGAAACRSQSYGVTFMVIQMRVGQSGHSLSLEPRSGSGKRRTKKNFCPQSSLFLGEAEEFRG